MKSRADPSGCGEEGVLQSNSGQREGGQVWGRCGAACPGEVPVMVAERRAHLSSMGLNLILRSLISETVSSVKGTGPGLALGDSSCLWGSHLFRTKYSQFTAHSASG